MALRNGIRRTLMALVAAGWVAWMHSASADDFRLAGWPPHAESPDFNLVDTDGVARSLADFRGHVVVVFFGFVHCPDACPTELFKLALVKKRLGKVGDRIQVVFVTLDPERDTPALLKSYAAAFDPSFIALTGTTARIDAAAANFFVQYARVGTGADYSINHSTSTYVIDATGRLRLIGGMKTTTADYEHDLKALAAGAQPAPH